MPDGEPFRQKYFRRTDDNESRISGQPFLIVFHAIPVALKQVFVILK
jgi:hypothetical protein